MRLANDQALWLLWLLPVLLLVVWVGHRYARRRLRRFAEQGLWPWVNPVAGAARQWTKALLLIMAAGLIIVGLTQPGWNPHVEETPRKGRDLVLLVDVSRSMLAEDISPNRLERAKLAIQDLISELRGDRVGIVAFAGNSVVKCPLTLDYGFARMAVSELDVNSVSRGGTKIGDAIRLVLDEVFDEQDTDYKDIILITDGEDQDTFPVQAAEKAGEIGVRLFALGLGQGGDGSLIPMTRNGRTTHLTYQGEPVRSRLDEETLIRMVQATPGGQYLPVGTSNFDLAEFYRSKIASAGQKELGSGRILRYEEKYQVFLGLALLLLVIEAWLSERVANRADRRRDSLAGDSAGQSVPARGRGSQAATTVGGIVILLVIVRYGGLGIATASAQQSTAPVRQPAIPAQQSMRPAQQPSPPGQGPMPPGPMSSQTAVTIPEQVKAMPPAEIVSRANELYQQGAYPQALTLLKAVSPATTVPGENDSGHPAGPLKADIESGDAAASGAEQSRSGQGTAGTQQGRFEQGPAGTEPLTADERAVVLYNLGNVYYRMGDFPRAVDCYEKASAMGRDEELVARSRFNQGNGYYQHAMQQGQSQPQEALETLDRSRMAYRKAQALRPDDTQIDHNLEVVGKTVKQLVEQLKQQPPQQQQSSDDSEQSDKNQDQQQQKQQDQQEDQQQQQDQNQQQDDSQQQSQQDPQQDQQQSQQGQQEDPPQSSEQQPQEDQQQQQQEQGEQEQQEADDSQGGDSQQPQQARALPRPKEPDPEAVKILNKERRRKQQQEQQRRLRAREVEKDW